MTVHTTPNTKYTKGVRWLAELYKNRQVDSVTAQTLNKLVDLEISRLRMQLGDMERVLADYEKTIPHDFGGIPEKIPVRENR